MLAQEKEFQLVVENAETAARDKRHDVAAAKTKRSIRRHDLVGDHPGPVALGIHRICRIVDRAVIAMLMIRDGEGDNFVNTDKCALHALIKAMNHASCVGHLGSGAEDGGLFDRTVHLAEAGELGCINDSTAQFLFGTSAANDHQ